MNVDEDPMAPSDGWTRTDITSMVAGFVFAVCVLTYAIFQGYSEAGGFSVDLLFVVIALVPAAMIWIWVKNSVHERELRSEIDVLNARLVSLRKHVDTIEDSLSPQVESEGLIDKINQIAQAQEKTDSTLAVFMSSRSPDAVVQFSHTAAPAPNPQQGSLSRHEMPDPQNPLTHEDFVRASNFPHSSEDRVGFAVLKLALENDKTGPFIRAAQDILTLLSQEGIYMDDLTPERTRADVWRHFGQGKRGKDIAPLGGIRDRKILEKVSQRMRQDMVFRDAVHHFLRKFDLVFTEFCEDATDEELAQFSETRSGRAFMLLGRIAGTFD